MIEKEKLKKICISSLIMVVLLSFVLFCAVGIVAILWGNSETMIWLLSVVIGAVIVDLILIYYYNIITIYKIEYNVKNVKMYATLKTYYITKPIVLEETTKSFLIRATGKRLIFPKYNRFPIEKDRCYVGADMDKLQEYLA